MYVNTLISLQENSSTYGTSGQKMTGHVMLSSPGVIRCYVQNLRLPSQGQPLTLCVLSKEKHLGARIGQLGRNKETRWIVNENNIQGTGIRLDEVDAVAIVAENTMRGVEAVLQGFSKERYMFMSILDELFPKAAKVSSFEQGPGPVKPSPVSQGPGPVIPSPVQQGPGPVIPPPVQQGPGPVIPSPVQQGPGPVIPSPVQQGPGPVIPSPVQQGPGPVIPPPVQQGPGPVIPSPVQQGPGPVIPPPVQQGPGPVIPSSVPQGPGPVIPSSVPQGPGPVIPPPRPSYPCEQGNPPPRPLYPDGVGNQMSEDFSEDYLVLPSGANVDPVDEMPEQNEEFKEKNVNSVNQANPETVLNKEKVLPPKGLPPNKKLASSPTVTESDRVDMGEHKQETDILEAELKRIIDKISKNQTDVQAEQQVTEEQEVEECLGDELKRIIDEISKDNRVAEKTRSLEKQIAQISSRPEAHKLGDKSSLQRALEEKYINKQELSEEFFEEEEMLIDTSPKKALESMNFLKEQELKENLVSKEDAESSREEGEKDNNSSEEKDYLQEIDRRLQEIRNRLDVSNKEER